MPNSFIVGKTNPVDEYQSIVQTPNEVRINKNEINLQSLWRTSNNHIWTVEIFINFFLWNPIT